jgi:putative glycosyltransferase (TIGR04348 family)
LVRHAQGVARRLLGNLLAAHPQYLEKFLHAGPARYFRRLSHLRKIIDGMNIQLVTPAPLGLNNGNKITALRWLGMLKSLGHRVKLTRRYDGAPCDALIALHARRSADSIRRFHELYPERPLIVVLTGTDLYRDIRRDSETKRSLELASRIIVLQRMAFLDLPRRLHPKTKVIYQSAAPVHARRGGARNQFRVCVIGHLREEKDPLRAPLAARDLPEDSRIVVTHIGHALDPELGKKAAEEAKRNRRFRWLSQRSHRRTREILAQSDLVCITSKLEGSSNVLSEALASGVPVLATKIPGLMGTLGKDFPGYFPVGDTSRLTRLLHKAETDEKFYRALKRHCARAAKLVRPKRELSDWQRLLSELE